MRKGLKYTGPVTGFKLSTPVASPSRKPSVIAIFSVVKVNAMYSGIEHLKGVSAHFHLLSDGDKSFRIVSSACWPLDTKEHATSSLRDME